ncbi:hypothetical protein [Paraburkholderia caledonica]|uniref:hypothetical protein n=1 Tax=Paraburkholderia caledonica TaxID=134536 RepID=UPI000524C772|nr:hypothetical protein [Paraburkholderia caledonica]
MQKKIKDMFRKISASDVIAIVGILVAIWLTYHSDALQGVFQKSNVELGFENAPPIKAGEKIQFLVSVNENIKPSDTIYIPVEFDVKNAGDKELENVLLSLAYDKRGKHASDVFSESSYDHHGTMTSGNVRHESNSTDHFDYSNFTLFKLNVGDHPMLSDGVVAYQRPEQEPMLALSPLGALVKVELEAGNVPKKKYYIDYKVVEVAGQEQLVGWYKSYYVKAIAIEKREHASFFEYLLKIIHNNEEEIAFLVSPNYQSVLADERTVWVPNKSDSRLQMVSFNPYTWSLLFN